MQVILTGSYAYGTPTEKSDVDLVFFADKNEPLDDRFWWAMAMFWELHGGRPGSDYPSQRYTFKGLDIIHAATEEDFNIWKEGTLDLMAVKPVTRREAVDYFAALRKEREYGDTGRKRNARKR